MSNNGWIRLHRQITDCWIWDDNEPYTKAQAWIYLLMVVNHTEVQTYFDGKIITVNTGQRITSIRKLSDKFGWSRTKVTHFLSLLEQDNMVKVESDSKKTLITVINYEKYQSDEPQQSHEKDSEEPQKSHSKATGEPQKSTNNNDKNDKNDKNDNIINPPISPQGENGEWSFDKHTNIDNAKYLLNNNLYSETDYIKENALWEIIKDWLEYKDAKKPKNQNHYVNARSMTTLFNEFVNNCKEHGATWVTDSVNHSMSRTWMGIKWGEGITEKHDNLATRKSNIDIWSGL